MLNNIILTFSTSATLLCINIVTGILTARILGPTGKGQLTAVLVWISMLTMLGSLGITEAINYFTAKTPGSQGKVLATGIFIGGCQSLLLILIGWLFTPLILQRQEPDVVILSRYYLLFIPLNLFTLYLQAFLGGKLQFGAYNLIRFTVAVAILLGLLFLLLSGQFSVLNVIIVYLIANAITLAMAFYSVFRMPDNGYSPDRRMAGSMLIYGAKAHASNVTMTVNERFDQLIIAMILPAVQLGYYAVAVSLTTGIMMIGTSIAIVALPVVAKLRDDAARAESISRFFRVTFWFSVTAAIVFILTAHFLILLLFGDVYLPAENATRILLIAAIPLSGNRVLQAALKSANQPLQAGMAELIAVLLTVILLLVLLPKLGIVGAAITSFVAYFVSGVYMIVFLRNKIGCDLRDMFLPQAQDFGYVASLLRTQP